LENLVSEYEKKDATKLKNSRNLFNKIINALGKLNTDFFKEGAVPIKGCEKEDRPQVFLSHAYDDRLYALALFDYIEFNLYKNVKVPQNLLDYLFADFSMFRAIREIR
jgi:hypothetical protein